MEKKEHGNPMCRACRERVYTINGLYSKQMRQSVEYARKPLCKR